MARPSASAPSTSWQRPWAFSQNGAGHTPGDEPGAIEDLNGAIADPDQAVAFEVLAHLVQRGALHAEHGGQGPLWQLHASVGRLFGQQAGGLGGQ